MIMSKEMPTTREELAEFVKEYIKENLTVRVGQERFDEKEVNVTLYLDDEFISTDYFRKD